MKRELRKLGSINNGSWSIEQESDVEKLKKSVSHTMMHEGKTFGQEKKQLEERRKDFEKKLLELETKRTSVLGLTLEKFLGRRRSDWTVYYSFYEDRECTKLVFSEEEFEDLDHQELGELVFEYNQIFDNYDHLNIRRIACQPYFLNKFFIANGDPMVFFGRSAVSLTQFQSELMSQGRTYKNILESEEGSPPETWYDDPDKLVKWYYAKMKINSDSMPDGPKDLDSGKDWKGASTIPGADLEEMKAVAAAKSEVVVDLNEEVEKMKKKKGGKDLTFYDILRLHGENPDTIEEMALAEEKLKKEAVNKD